MSVCHTVSANFNLRSRRLRNLGLELRSASESSTATAGEVLQQLGDAPFIRSEVHNT